MTIEDFSHRKNSQTAKGAHCFCLSVCSFNPVVRRTWRSKGIPKTSVPRWVPWAGVGGGESPLSNPYYSAKPKLSVFENEPFSGHFFFYQKFSKKCKMLWGKVLESFLTLKKIFFSGQFF